MGHPFLTRNSMLVLAGFGGFIYYLSGAFRGPQAPKFDIPRIAKERLPKDEPMFATMFAPETHPALMKKD